MSQFVEMFGNTPMSYEMQDCFSLIRNGANIKQGQFEGGIPITRIETISDEIVDRQKMGYAGIADNKYELYYLQDGDILISHINSLKHIGKCALYNKKENESIIHGMNLLCLRPNIVTINPVFAIHMLRSNIIRKGITDITKPAVNQASFSAKDFGKLRTIIPPMDKQMLFVSIAEQADKSKFGDFKSQFIEIFYGMETTPVKDYIDDSFPGEWGTEDKDGNGVKVIRTTNFTNSGKLNLADVVTRSIEDRKVVRKQIKKYDTILERSGGTADNPVGRVVLFEEDNLFLCNNFTQVLRFKDVDPRFAFYALYYFYQTNRTAIRSMGSKTTGIQNLNMSKYLEIGIPNASDEDQKAFVTIAEQADKSKSVIQKALVYLNDIQSDELGKIA